MRAEKGEAIHIYLDELEKLMHTLSRSTTIRNATDMLSAEFNRSLGREQQFGRAQESDLLANLYTQGFGSQFRQMNPNLAADTPLTF